MDAYSIPSRFAFPPMHILFRIVFILGMIRHGLLPMLSLTLWMLWLFSLPDSRNSLEAGIASSRDRLWTYIIFGCPFSPMGCNLSGFPSRYVRVLCTLVGHLSQAIIGHFCELRGP